tara:strand:+ start:335 stop:436 length:102 start_codon:yes stop_codon:yes gene_type:complete
MEKVARRKINEDRKNAMEEDIKRDPEDILIVSK